MADATKISKAEIMEDTTKYMKGNKEAIGGDLLISNSKFLNSAPLRDYFVQQAFRKIGKDIPSAYLVPDLNHALTALSDQDYVTQAIAAARTRIPEFAQWLDARFVSNVQAQDVEHCAPGTLGVRVHDFIVNSGMTMDFSPIEPTNDVEYIYRRLGQTHDILHMVTGLDTSSPGEIGLHAAYVMSDSNYFKDPQLVAEIGRVFIFSMTAAVLRSVCHYHSALPTYLEAIGRGHALGFKQKKPLWMVNWEEYFDWQMSDIRKEFSFEDGPEDGAWDWTYAACREPE